MKLWLLLPVLFWGLLTAHASEGDRYLLSESLAVGAQCVAPTDKDPWPWGTECPFPWNDVSGTWRLESAGETLENSTYSHMKIQPLGVDELGTRYFRFKRYDAENRLVTQGVGTALRDERIVRAVLRGSKAVKPEYVVLRAYKMDAEAELCQAGKLVKALSISTRHCTDTDDLHYSLEPMN